jgi:lysyl-tRNA synthetase class 1
MVTVVQVAPGNIDAAVQILQRSGYAVDNLHGLRQRAAYAQRWLETFAPEDMKFRLQEHLPPAASELTAEQRHALRRLGERLQSGMSGEEIHQLIYTLKDELDLKPDQLFKAIYLALLGKSQGPRAGWFLSTLNPTFVKQRFAEAAAVGGNDSCP